MSRKGKAPIEIPQGVQIDLNDDVVTVKGPKGTLTQVVHPTINVTIEDNVIKLTDKSNSAKNKNFHGLMRSLIQNMVTGVSKGFEKQLEMIGVGYRAAVKGNEIDLQIGKSHPTLLPIPENVTVKVEKNTQIIIQGADLQKIGQFAADIRAQRPPEVYQGKGIRYKGEYVRKKAGKSATK